MSRATLAQPAIIEVGARAKTYRRLWIALRLASLLPAFVLLTFSFIALFNYVTGAGFFGGNKFIDNILGMTLVESVIASVQLIVAAFVLAAAGRYGRAPLVAASAGALVLAAIAVKSGFDNRNYQDLDVLPLVEIGLTVVGGLGAAYCCTVLFLRAENRMSSRFASRFVKLVEHRRRSYRQIEWRKIYWLFLAIVAVVILYFATNGFIALMMELFDVPISAFKSEEELVALGNAHELKLAMTSIFSLALLLLWAIVSHFIWRSGWRRVRRSAEAVIGQASYEPIVFLRSFQDEHARVKPKGLFTLLSGRRPRLEEVLVGSIARLGPSVAIGLPGEKLPPLGAFRAYYSDEEWRPAVIGWMRRAYAIVVVGGASNWALWELNHILSNGLAQKLIMVLPPDDTEEERMHRWKALRSAVAGSRWEQAINSLDGRRLLCVTFAKGGDVTAIIGSDKHQSDYEIAMQSGVTLVNHANTAAY